MLTKITDTALPGPITGVYGPGGELARQTLPGTPGITQAFTTDATGDTVSTTWADGVGNLFLGDAQVSDVHGRWAQQTLTGATPGWEQRGYGYDPAGRLTRVGETREDTTGCTTRSYAFDVNSNRTSTTSYPDGGAGCTTSSTPTSTQTLVYDSADRLLSSGSAAGVGYDAWGRITTLPAGLTGTPAAGAATVGYHVNDLARSTTQGGVTRAWTLDPAGRLASMGTTGAGSTALANHYADAGTDSPDWTLDTSSGGTTTTRRYLDGLTGGLTIEAATTHHRRQHHPDRPVGRVARRHPAHHHPDRHRIPRRARHRHQRIRRRPRHDRGPHHRPPPRLARRAPTPRRHREHRADPHGRPPVCPPPRPIPPNRPHLRRQPQHLHLPRRPGR